MTAEDERDLYEQIEKPVRIEPDQRRLFTLANIAEPAAARASSKGGWKAASTARSSTTSRTT